MIYPYGDKLPSIAPGVRAADNCSIIGDVRLDEDVSIFYGAVLRGDNNPILIGRETNIQDNTVIHMDHYERVVIGERVTVGHSVILHGCTIEDECTIGMGAILLNGCVIGKGSLVAAGALVTQKKIIPPGSLVMGSPARVVRPLTEEELAGNIRSALHYVEAAKKQLPLLNGGNVQ